MKYARTFALLAVLCVGGAALSSHVLVAVLFGWNALAWALLAWGFANRRPQLFGKRSNGTLRPLQVLVLAPYHVLNAVSYALACASAREEAAHEIVPGLWLGRRLSRLSRRDRRFLSALSCGAVLDAAAEMPESGALRKMERLYRSLPLLDTAAPSEDEMENTARWIEARLAQGPVYVHCALGHGRSATLVAAFLMLSGRASSVEQSLAIIQSRRPHIEPSQEQVHALRRLGETISATRVQ